MRKIYFVLIASFAILSCQIEEDGTPAPNESFIKYYGELTSYEAADIEYLYDSSGFIILGSVLGEDGATDLSLIRVDLDGGWRDSIQVSIDIPLGRDVNGDGIGPDTLAGNSTASQIEVFDGGFAIVGTTLLNEVNLNIQNVSVATIQLFNNDFQPLIDTVFRIGTDIDPEDDEYNPEDGLDLFAADIIRLNNGGFLFLGTVEVSRDATSDDTDFDYRLIKFGGGGAFIETWGVPGEDEFGVRVFEKDNGNLVVIGYSENESALGENNGNNGFNVEFLEFTSSGQPLNSVSYGIDNPDPTNVTVFNEQVYDAIQTATGYAIAGTSTVDEDTYAFFMNLSQNGQYLSGDTLSSAFRLDQEGLNSIQTNGFGIVQASDNDYIVLGSYPSFNYQLNVDDPTRQPESRAGEAMFMKVDQTGIPVDEFEDNFGTADGNDFAVDALSLPDGKIMMLSNIDFGGGIQLVSLIKLNKTGNLED